MIAMLPSVVKMHHPTFAMLSSVSRMRRAVSVVALPPEPAPPAACSNMAPAAAAAGVLVLLRDAERDRTPPAPSRGELALEPPPVMACTSAAAGCDAAGVCV